MVFLIAFLFVCLGFYLIIYLFIWTIIVMCVACKCQCFGEKITAFHMDETSSAFGRKSAFWKRQKAEFRLFEKKFEFFFLRFFCLMEVFFFFGRFRQRDCCLNAAFLPHCSLVACKSLNQSIWRWQNRKALGRHLKVSCSCSWKKALMNAEHAFPL